VVTRAELVAEALSWQGTPHLWQQSRKGRGCDCLGLVWGVARALELPEARGLAKQNYGRGFSGNQLLTGLAGVLRETAEPQPGDVMVLFVGNPAQPRHCAMMLDNRRLIHGYPGGLDRVIVTPIGNSRPVHSYWTWPSLGGE
jgi:cell wall-associated NlpC family hydrolase